MRLLAKETEEKKFQHLGYENYKVEEFDYLGDVMGPVYHKCITNKPICNVL